MDLASSSPASAVGDASGRLRTRPDRAIAPRCAAARGWPPTVSAGSWPDQVSADWAYSGADGAGIGVCVLDIWSALIRPLPSETIQAATSTWISFV
jgi:hypothetical protein